MEEKHIYTYKIELNLWEIAPHNRSPHHYFFNIFFRHKQLKQNRNETVCEQQLIQWIFLWYSLDQFNGNGIVVCLTLLIFLIKIHGIYSISGWIIRYETCWSIWSIAQFCKIALISEIIFPVYVDDIILKNRNIFGLLLILMKRNETYLNKCRIRS